MLKEHIPEIPMFVSNESNKNKESILENHYLECVSALKYCATIDRA